MRTCLAVVLVWGCSGSDEGAETDDDPGTELPEWPDAWVELEAGVIELCNAHRQIGAICCCDINGNPEGMPGGLDHLEMDPVLRGTARAHSLDMAERGYFAHEDPQGVGPFDRIEAAGFTGAQPWGENIAAGVNEAALVVDLWMQSHEGHCQNIMEPEFRVIGVGYDYDETSEFGYYWTQNFAGSH